MKRPSFALFHKFFFQSWSDGIFDNHRRLGSATVEFLSYFRIWEYLLPKACKMVCHSKRQVVLRNEICEQSFASNFMRSAFTVTKKFITGAVVFCDFCSRVCFSVTE